MKNQRHTHLFSLSLLFLFLFAGIASAAVPVTSQQKLVADDAFKDSAFGWRVAVDGDTAVVSAFADYDGTGAAYVYERSGSGWQQVAKLTASDGVEQDALGISAAISGDTIVLGAALDDNDGGTDAGAVYVYVKPGSGWSSMTESFKLTSPAPQPDRGFGGAVALAGDLLVVGAPGKDDALSSGDLFIFQGGGSSWSHKATLNVSGLTGFDAFGSVIDFDGTTIVAGAFGQDGSRGAAYVYRRPSGGWRNMSPDAVLLAGDRAPDDYFGGTVAVDGDTIVVGANGDDDNGDKSGSAYIFVRSGGGWEQQAKLTPSDGEAGDNFGYYVDLNANTAIIGASSFSENATADSFYMFTRSNGSWVERGEVSDPDNRDGSKFGSSLAIDGSGATVLVGAPGADAGSERQQKSAGAAYLFELEPPVDLALVKQDDTDPVLLGNSVTYTLLVTNSGDSDATAVTVTDTLPAGMSYISDDAGCSHAAQVVECNLGSIGANGGTASVRITVRADSAGSKTNTATVSSAQSDADSSNNSDSETTMVRENRPPQALDDTVTTDEDTPVTTGNVLANDSDPDGDTLSVSGVESRSAQGGSVVDNGDGTFTYTPPAGFSGSDSFGYTVADGNGGEDRATVRVTVNAVNHPPVAMDDSVTTNEDTPVTTGNVLANDSDPDGDTLSVSGVESRSAQGGSVVDNGNGTFTYTPPAGFSGSDSFGYTVSDGNGGEARGTVRVTVTEVVPVNNPPVAGPDSATTSQDTAITINLLANDSDPDGDSLGIGSVDGQSAQGGSVADNGDGSVTYTPPPGYAGSDSFGYVVVDGRGGQARGVVRITVEQPLGNTAPVAANDSAQTEVDSAVTIDVLANDSDADGDPLSVIGADSRSANGGVVENLGDGRFTYTPPAGFVGEDSFQYTISDGNGGEDSATVTIAVEEAADGESLWLGSLDLWMLLMLLPFGYRYLHGREGARVRA